MIYCEYYMGSNCVIIFRNNECIVSCISFFLNKINYMRIDEYGDECVYNLMDI